MGWTRGERGGGRGGRTRRCGARRPPALQPARRGVQRTIARTEVHEWGTCDVRKRGGRGGGHRGWAGAGAGASQPTAARKKWLRTVRRGKQGPGQRRRGGPAAVLHAARRAGRTRHLRGPPPGSWPLLLSPLRGAGGSVWMCGHAMPQGWAVEPGRDLTAGRSSWVGGPSGAQKPVPRRRPAR